MQREWNDRQRDGEETWRSGRRVRQGRRRRRPGVGQTVSLRSPRGQERFRAKWRRHDTKRTNPRVRQQRQEERQCVATFGQCAPHAKAAIICGQRLERIHMPRRGCPPFRLKARHGRCDSPKMAGTRVTGARGACYTVDSRWRNRAEFITGPRGDRGVSHAQVAARARLPLIKELRAFRDDRIAVRFAYEWHDDGGNWFRSFGNENWSSTRTA